MKKIFFILIFSLSHFFYAQKDIIETKIFLTDGTISDSKVKFSVNPFWKDLVDVSSIVSKKIIVIDENNQEKKILASTVERLEFIDLKGAKRVFVRFPEYKNLVELVHDGKIKWIRYYYEHGYDHSTQQADHLYKQGSKMVGLGIFTNNRKKLKELMFDKPELFTLIEKINYDKLKDDDLIQILKNYDEL